MADIVVNFSTLTVKNVTIYNVYKIRFTEKVTTYLINSDVKVIFNY